MPVFCVNTGDTLHKKCKLHYCLHFDSRSKTNCLQHMYQRPLTALDVAHMEGKTYLDSRRMQRSAETKIAAWGRVLDKLDDMKAQPFIAFIDTVYNREESLAIKIADDPYLCIVRPMRFVKSELWVSILQTFHGLLEESGIATAQNKETWNHLTNYELF